jgi:hypothetical protein
MGIYVCVRAQKEEYEPVKTAATANMASEVTTKTGKPLYKPNESDLYQVNPCPPASYLPIQCDYTDDSGRKYWLVSPSRPKLFEWLNNSPLIDMITPVFDTEKDMLFFVQRSKESSANHAVFVLTEEGDELILLPAKRKKKSDRETTTSLSVSVRCNGQSSSSSYTARTIRWTIVRCVDK